MYLINQIAVALGVLGTIQKKTSAFNRRRNYECGKFECRQ
jgi:hypothetical protein